MPLFPFRTVQAVRVGAKSGTSLRSSPHSKSFARAKGASVSARFWSAAPSRCRFSPSGRLRRFERVPKAVLRFAPHRSPRASPERKARGFPPGFGVRRSRVPLFPFRTVRAVRAGAKSGTSLRSPPHSKSFARAKGASVSARFWSAAPSRCRFFQLGRRQVKTCASPVFLTPCPITCLHPHDS